MPLFTIQEGIEPGAYTVILVSVSGPKTITAKTGPKAGEDVKIFDWVFAIDEGELDGTEITASSSTASGPKSKLYQWLTALLGKAPTAGDQFEATDLAGRRAIATIEMSDTGWPRITQLSALPKQKLAAGIAKATGAPLKGLPAAVGVSARDAVAEGTEPSDDLPF